MPAPSSANNDDKVTNIVNTNAHPSSAGTRTGRAKAKPAWVAFVTGGIGSSLGAAFAHPLDLVKVRMQVQGEVKARLTHGPRRPPTAQVGLVGMGKRILLVDGVAGLYAGVGASISRQIVYSSVRFGVYDLLKEMALDMQRETGTALNCDNRVLLTLPSSPTAPTPVIQASPAEELGLLVKIPCAMLAGCVGAFAGNPADLVMVRMQADGKRPAAERRNYRGVFDALRRVAQAEGIPALWLSGVLPNMARASIITVGHLAAYDTLKLTYTQSFGLDSTSVLTHLVSAVSAAGVSSIISNPVDVVKTRLMNALPGRYRGVVHCVATTLRAEGLVGLYKGFGATISRQVPYVTMSWLIVEQLKQLT